MHAGELKFKGYFEADGTVIEIINFSIVRTDGIEYGGAFNLDETVFAEMPVIDENFFDQAYIPTPNLYGLNPSKYQLIDDFLFKVFPIAVREFPDFSTFLIDTATRLSDEGEIPLYNADENLPVIYREFTIYLVKELKPKFKSVECRNLTPAGNLGTLMQYIHGGNK